MRRKSGVPLWGSILAGLALLALPGCFTDACGCSPPQSDGFVYGAVAEPGGAAAAGATIRVFADAGTGCLSRTGQVAEGTSLGDGTYSLTVIGPAMPHTACIKVVAAPPAARADLLPSDTVATVLRLSTLLDSVRVDLVLKAR